MKTPVRSFHSILLALAVAAMPLAAQTSLSSTDGFTPPTMAPGSPQSSYQLSDFDTIHPGTRRLNFRLVLHTVQGRGSIAIPIVLRLSRSWQVLSVPNPIGSPPTSFTYKYFGVDTMWANLEADYSPGYLMGRPATVGGPDQYGHAQYSNTQLTFVGPDGTEIELRDQATLGHRQQIGYNRGRVFVSVDGSAATFISDDDIYDSIYAQAGGPYPVSGTMFTRDGTRYRIDSGRIAEITDRNGNYATIEYTLAGLPASITDSLGRTVTFSYNAPVEGDPNTTVDTITYKGSDGTDRHIEIYRTSLVSVLAEGLVLKNRTELFDPASPDGLHCAEPNEGGCDTTIYNPSDLASKVEYENGDTYEFKYDEYAQVVQVTLPTGGGYQYEYEADLDCAGCSSSCVYNACRYIYGRDVTEKRTYSSMASGTLVARTTFGGDAGGGAVVTKDVKEEGGVTSEVVVEATRHYYLYPDSTTFDATAFPSWQSLREYKVETLDTNLTTVLQSVEHTWTQRTPAEPGFVDDPTAYNTRLHDPRITQTDTTNDQGQVARQSFLYDNYNNNTQTTEYDWASSAPGPQLRRTVRTYVTGGGYDTVGTNPDATYHLRSLPSSETVYDSTGTLAASALYYYDKTTESNPTPSAPTANTGAVGHESRFGSSYAIRGNLTRIRKLQSGTTYIAMNRDYDVNGNLISSSDARGNTATFGYADDYDVGTPPGATYGFVTSVTLPAARSGQPAMTENYAYNYYLGSPTSHEEAHEQGANGPVTQYQYEGENFDPGRMDRLKRIIAPEDGAKTVYSYTDGVNPSVTTCQDLDGSNRCEAGGSPVTSTTRYDGLGRAIRTEESSPGGTIVVTTEYDALNRKSKVSNPGYGGAGALTTYTYDLLGRVVSVCTADGACTETDYAGATATVTDPAQKARRSQTDALNRLVKVTEDPNGLNYVTSYGYDGLGDLRRVCQGGTFNPSADTCTGGQFRKFEYDKLGRLLSANNPESGVINYGYDANGNMTQRVAADLSTTTIDYDALNRPYWKRYSGARTAAAVTTCYDGYAFGGSDGNCSAGSATNAKMRVSAVHSSDSENTYGYDGRGRITAYTQVTGGTSYAFTNFTYNLFGGLTGVTYPSGRRVTQIYDNRWVTEIGYSLGGTTGSYASSVQYAPHGAVSQIAFGNGVTETWQFNSARQQPTCLTAAKSGTTLFSLGLGYTAQASGCNASGTDNNGNLRSEVIGNRVQTFTRSYGYDGLNRVASAAEGSNWSRTFGYDAYGNMWAGGSGVPLDSFTPTGAGWYDANNRLINTGLGIAYDAAGNQTDIGGFHRTYDGEGRLKTSALNQVTTTYTYDGDGRRVTKQAGTGTTVYVYDAAGQLAAEYGASEPAPCTTCYLTVDHLGSTRMMTAQDGNLTFGDLGYIVKSLHDYLPFGEEVPAEIGGRSSTYYPSSTLAINDGTAQKFTGKERDQETGLDYFGARYYSGAQARFLSVDPVFISAGRLSSPNALNLYSYARNNPLRFIDPSGLEVRMANDTTEGRWIAMMFQRRGMKPHEAANIGYHTDKNGKYVMYIRDPNAVDVSSASTAYKELSGRIGSSTAFNYGIVGGGLTATFRGTGQVRSWSRGGSVGENAAGEVDVLIDRNVSVKVKVFDDNGGEVLGDEPPFMTAMHELLGETLKYTEGHSDLRGDGAKDDRAVIGIENAIRGSLGMPLRTGSDHYDHEGPYAQPVDIPYDPSPLPTRIK